MSKTKTLNDLSADLRDLIKDLRVQYESHIEAYADQVLTERTQSDLPISTIIHEALDICPWFVQDELKALVPLVSNSKETSRGYSGEEFTDAYQLFHSDLTEKIVEILEETRGNLSDTLNEMFQDTSMISVVLDSYDYKISIYCPSVVAFNTVDLADPRAFLQWAYRFAGNHGNFIEALPAHIKEQEDLVDQALLKEIWNKAQEGIIS